MTSYDNIRLTTMGKQFSDKIGRSQHSEKSAAKKASNKPRKRPTNSKKRAALKRLYDKRWKTIYAALVEFKSIHGDTRVPRDYITDDGVSLGQWVMTQRRENSKREKGRPNRMSRERIQMLEDIDFQWKRQKQLFEI